LPGLAQRRFAGRVLRSKTEARGGNPERRGPTMALDIDIKGLPGQENWIFLFARTETLTQEDPWNF
jgi:hypothetical protein